MNSVCQTGVKNANTKQLGLCSIMIMIAIYRRVVPAIPVDH